MNLTKKETIKYLFENRDLLIAKRKSTMKHADSVGGIVHNVVKSEGAKTESENEPRRKLVINTCNIIDGHMDCHIPGIWNKTVKENKMFYLLQEHKMEYKYIIADSVNDDLKAKVEQLTWNQLGQDYDGQTESLVFDISIPERNEYMKQMYIKNYVLNHSVGMNYVKMYLCLNSEESYHSQERDNWEKYIGNVVNQDVAEKYGYFWAVTEAKMIEGSAVPIGSNFATPTLELSTSESQESTRKDIEPPEGTQENKSSINLLMLTT